VAYTRQQWRDALVRSADAGERARTAGISLSAFVGAIVLLVGWNSGHLRHPVLVVIGGAFLVASLLQFVLFVLRRLRASSQQSPH
jgi:hypothetical protein